MLYKHWSPDMVIDHILSRVGHEPLYSHYYATTYPQVHAAAQRIFGSWKNAITACNLNYNLVRRYRVWNRDAVVSEIRKLLQQHADLSSRAVQEEHKALYMAAIKRYGNWGNALSASGVHYDEIRLRQQPSAEEIKAEILKIYRRGESLAYTHMRSNYQNLLAHGIRKLGNGSWVKARKACGIEDNFRVLGQRTANRRRVNMEEFIYSLEDLLLPEASR